MYFLYFIFRYHITVNKDDYKHDKPNFQRHPVPCVALRCGALRCVAERWGALRTSCVSLDICLTKPRSREFDICLCGPRVHRNIEYTLRLYVTWPGSCNWPHVTALAISSALREIESASIFSRDVTERQRRKRACGPLH